MKIIHQWDDFESGTNPIALAIGAFDGVHRGHQELIRTAVEHARRLNGEAWALTFDPHPAKVLRPQAAPRLLTSTTHKLHLLEELGLDGCLVLPFTPEFSRLEPEEFVDQLCRHVRELREAVVGRNWTFGHRASGNPARLEALATSRGFRVTVPDWIEWRGEPVSSTRIRDALEAGQLADVREMLGRPFSLSGYVTEGRKLGRELGFPTANIHPVDEARPPIGVYVVYGVIRGRRYPGAAYLGRRPTEHGQDQRYILETHFFDVSLDLYGQEIELYFLEQLRGDQRFDSHEALKEQIARDVATARRRFAEK